MLEMLSYPFMQYAFVASFFISILCGLMGVFVVARKTAFFTHTLSEISFSGASFGVFLGTNPILGMLLFTVLSSLMIGTVGSRVSRRESSISVFSVFFIGLGILFLSLADTQSSYATNILFGSIVGISYSNVQTLVGLSIAIIVITTLIYRKLKYNSFDNVGASFNSRANTLVSVIFLILLACTVSVTSNLCSIDHSSLISTLLRAQYLVNDHFDICLFFNWDLVWSILKLCNESTSDFLYRNNRNNHLYYCGNL